MTKDWSPLRDEIQQLYQDFPKPNRISHPSRKRLGSSSATRGVRTTSALPLAADSFNPSNRRTDLHLAVLGQDEQQVQRLLFDGNSVKDEDNVGNQPLHYAVDGTSENIVSLLIKYGADVNAKGQLGRSPLHLAVSKEDFTRHLLTAGADTNLQDENGDTPVHLAVLDFVQKTRSSNLEWFPSALYAMIGAKCDLNLSNLAGMTPFHGLLARDPHASPGSISDCQIHCLQNGASPTQPCSDADARTPLQILLSYFSRDSPITRWDKAACKVIRILIEKGADPQTKLPSGMTLVSRYFEAFGLGWSRWGSKPSHELGETLCKYADLMPLSGSGGRLKASLLHILAQTCVSNTGYRAFDIIAFFKVVLQRGADPNLPDEEGKTPLHQLYQTKGNAPDIVLRATELMIKHGGNPFIADSSGKSPLFGASEFRPSRPSVNYVYHLLKSTLDFDEILSTPRERQSSKRECPWDDWDSAANANDWDQAIKFIKGSRPSCSDVGMVASEDIGHSTSES
ncbi:ankyrin repeat-containing domain protein [Colletotrichum acutatum]|uniref:Ankyrin repeat-containing domain protein n=1 Tax=Glomerella acutata TaxID=27357 RepID=A0AAD8UDT6_GLOAC|nr:ankyrin repeat-containing domain protein [Colletotrichum acutatum]KAK1721320.1 ankyrin repeat-containing domain protein [Colletotrichum acutatum]